MYLLLSLTYFILNSITTISFVIPINLNRPLENILDFRIALLNLISIALGTMCVFV